MISTFVIDASVVVAELTEDRNLIPDEKGVVLMAPSVLPYEVTNVMRKLDAKRESPDHRRHDAVRLLRDLPILYWPWEALAERVWQLRHNLTSTDASYVAVAELADATLLTKDGKLAAAPGIRCHVRVV